MGGGWGGLPNPLVLFSIWLIKNIPTRTSTCFGQVGVERQLYIVWLESTMPYLLAHVLLVSSMG